MTTATLTTLDPEIAALRDEQARLRRQLRRTRNRLRLQMALEFVLDEAAGLVLLAAVLIGLDYWLRPNLATRQVVGYLGLMIWLFVLTRRSAPRFRAMRLDDLGLALTLDRFRPGTGQEVADVLQLPGQLEDASYAASPALVRLAVRRASESLAGVDWRVHWNELRTVGRLTALVAVLAVPTIFALEVPHVARLCWARWVGGSTERWPQRTYLSVTGLGDRDHLIAPRDEPFPVEVRADLPVMERQAAGWSIPGRGEPLVLRREPKRVAIPEDVRLRERAGEGAVRDAVMNGLGAGRFRLDLPPASSSSSFTLAGGDDWLGPIRVDRVDRPSLATTQLRVREPGASDGAYRTITDTRQHLIFLPETEVEITLVGTEAIRAARVEIHPGTAPALTRVDPKTFTAHWTLREATTLEIMLTSDVTGLASKPTFLSLGILKDREPRVILRVQGVGGHVTSVATIPLTIVATDDLGLAAIRLNVDRTVQDGDKAEPVSTKQVVAIPLATDGPRAILDHQARHDVILQASPPPIGAVLRLMAEAEDRSARGTQVGRSGVLHFQVVSPDELFYEILIRQRAERAKFIAAYDAAGKLRTTLAGTPTVEDYTAASRSLHTGTRQLELIAGRIGDSLAEMKLNQVGSPKSHRLLQDGVIDPILALNAGPASELRATLQALASSSKAQGDAEVARTRHGAYMAKMKIILDQMSQWESFVDVVNQVAEVIKIQQNVLKATEQARAAGLVGCSERGRIEIGADQTLGGARLLDLGDERDPPALCLASIARTKPRVGGAAWACSSIVSTKRPRAPSATSRRL